MKIVRDNLFEFHKGSNPLASLGLGPYGEWVYSIFDACGVPREEYRIEGNRTIFSRSLDLSGCTQLTELPSGLSIGRSLDLSGCTSLVELPSGLNVDGWLYLNGCTSLVELPGGLKVGNNIYVNKDQTKLIEFIKNSKFKNKLKIE